MVGGGIGLKLSTFTVSSAYEAHSLFRQFEIRSICVAAWSWLRFSARRRGLKNVNKLEQFNF